VALTRAGRRRVGLQACRRDQLGDRHVVADHQQQLDHLARAEQRVELGYALLARLPAEDHLAREAENQALLRAQTRGLFAVVLDRGDLLVGGADGAGDRDMLHPLVGGVDEMGDLQDRELAQ